MKKLLGLLALTVAASSIAAADQDVLKSISVDTNVRYRYQDLDSTEEDGYLIGNEGFSKENRIRTRWLKTVSGSLTLSDELGMDADFSVTHRNQTDRDGNTRTARSEYWNPKVTLKKAFSFGNLDTIVKLSYENETNRPKTGIKEGMYKTGSIFNEIVLGPEFKINVFGQNIGVDTGVVYFKLNGGADNNLPYAANDSINGKIEGWGLNLNLSTGGNILDTNYGTVSYDLGFVNKLRDGNAKRYNTVTGEVERYGSNIYLDYTQNVKYTTPSFAGFYGNLILQNEWEKHTSKTGWKNTFDVITGLGYKTKFDTPVGGLTVNPYTSYNVVNRETKYNKHKTDNKKLTVEKNELRAGVNLSLDVE